MEEPRKLELTRGIHRYIFIFDHQGTSALLQVLGKCAADPDLNLSWHDVARLCPTISRLSPSQITIKNKVEL